MGLADTMINDVEGDSTPSAQFNQQEMATNEQF